MSIRTDLFHRLGSPTTRRLAARSRLSAAIVVSLCGLAAGSAVNDPDRQSASVALSPDGTPPADERSSGILPGPLTLGKPKDSTAKFEWQGPETNYKVNPVECNGVNIGRLDFKYRPYFDQKGGVDGGGAALEGGFTANGMSPCPFFGQKPNTEYFWIQTITTNTPATGHGPGEYTDSDNPRRNPQYPHQSNDNNPANTPFTGRSFYDGPFRFERAGDVHWLAENMLCCRSDHKIHVIGSFLWGFDIDGSPNTSNGAAGVHGNPRHAWGPATSSAIDTVAKEAQGNKTEEGWSIREGCCCANLFVCLTMFCDSTGLCQLPIDGSNPQGVLDQVLVFPRNKAVTLFNPPAPGWVAQPWGSNIAPPMPYQTTGLTMWQQGVRFINTTPHPGPASYSLQFRVAAHESFFDVFVHDAITNQWINWVDRSQELLGDMNGDNVIDLSDLPVWDLAFTNPAGYAAQYPGQNAIFRGDLSHNAVLDPGDRSLLQDVITHSVPADAIDLAPVSCNEDIDNNLVIDIDDLVRLITHWNQTTGSEDINGDGVINIDDLVLLITHWGPC